MQLDKFLITGGAGFIGSHLVEYCLKRGYFVRILDNYSQSSKENLEFLKQFPETSYEIIEGDIRDKECCIQATKDMDYVLHQAALGSVPRSLKEPELYEENNVKGTLNILLAAKENNIKRVVQASSSSVYGDTLVLPKVETMLPSPKSPYALSKLACEHYGVIFTQFYNLPVISLRYFNVFGPRQNPFSQYAAVIPLFVKALLNDQAPTIFGDGSQTRDFTYIDNVIQANLNSCFAAEEATGKAYNIGGFKNISVNDLASKIKTLLNKHIDSNYVAKRKGDVQDSLADINLAKTFLNYTNSTSIDDGLTKTLNWYKKVLQKPKTL